MAGTAVVRGFHRVVFLSLQAPHHFYLRPSGCSGGGASSLLRDGCGVDPFAFLVDPVFCLAGRDGRRLSLGPCSPPWGWENGLDESRYPFRRVHHIPPLSVPAGALLLAVRGRHKVLFGVVFGVCAVLASLSGSKGALFSFLQIIGYVVYRRDLISNRVNQRLKLISIVLAVAAVFLGVAVLYAVTRDWSLAAGGLLRRVLLQGDVIIYYYDPGVLPHFASLGPLDYIYMILNPLLGGLRLVPYEFPLGFQMVTYYLGNPYVSEFAFGPNTPFFVAGHAYFGSYFGVIYCGVVGYVVARLRSLFLKAQNVSPLRLMWLLALAVLVYNLPVEVNLFTSPLMDMSLAVLLAAAVVYSFMFLVKSRPYPIRSFS